MSLDSKNFRVQESPWKPLGLRSIHASLSSVGALAFQKEPGCFLDVFEMLPPFYPLTCFYTPMLLPSILDYFFSSFFFFF